MSGSNASSFQSGAGSNLPGRAAHLADLNAPQYDAVTTLSGPLLVLAGAGTGKTRVITFRMAELIRNGIRPSRILSVTFTNKAAKEMLERTQALLGKRGAERPHISTFHSLCVRILREEIQRLGYPKTFTIFDRGDQESTARRALRDIRMTDAALRPGDLVNTISRWKTRGIRPEQASDAVECDQDRLAAMAYRRYQQQLRAAGAVDFDDLLLLTDQLLAEDEEVRARQQSRFDHVQIDEYQDTNELQFRIIQALVSPHENLCVVGDDDQSIYGWRGAEIKHILGFKQQFPAAKTIRLQDNYRCTHGIIELANKLVRHNLGRHEKSLVAHKQRDKDIVVRNYPDEQGEAEGVVREIAYLVQTGKVRPGDIAILFRTNEQPRVFESELRRVRVPYSLVGGQSFFDRREVRDIMAYLKHLSQPEDEVSLLRIINTPPRGIGETSVEKVLNRAVRDGKKFWDAVIPAREAGEITPKAATALVTFRQQLEDFRSRFLQPGADLPTELERLLTAIDYESEIQRQYKSADMQLARSGVLDECIRAVKDYQSRDAETSLAGFLEETALVGRDREFADGKSDELAQNSVKLMTLHSAKGLEFPRVFLVGLEEGLLPHQRSVDNGSRSAIEEERRLAYVGVTRAKDVLWLTRSDSRMKWNRRYQSVPSRFLAEMLAEEKGYPR